MLFKKKGVTLIITIVCLMGFYISIQQGLLSTIANRDSALSVKIVRDWLESMRSDDKEKAIKSILKGHAFGQIRLKTEDFKVPRAARPKIALAWDGGPHLAGWWPWDSPDTFKEFASYKCRASCDWYDIKAGDQAMRTANAIVFHGPFSGPSVPMEYRLKYGKGLHQSYWLMTHESNANYNVQKNPDFLREIDHKMTYDLDDEVPITYAYRVWLQSFFQLHPKRDDADAIFVSSNCAPKNQRLIWVREIMKHIRVHSYGGCEHNKDMPEDRGQDSRKKLALQGSYKFCLCFDNTDQKDYISEKFFHALASGCVPVYMGTPTIDKYLPTPEAAVLTRDFDSPQALAKHLKYLIDNPEEYNKKLAWKGGGVNGTGVKQGIDKLIELQYLSFLSGPCRLCEYLAGANSTRTTQEQWETHKGLVRMAVRNKMWSQSHDRDGLKGLSTPNNQLEFMLNEDGTEELSPEEQAAAAEADSEDEEPSVPIAQKRSKSKEDAEEEEPAVVDKGVSIALYWNEPRNSGWWPWEHPETMEAMLNGCRAKCDFVNPSEGKEKMQAAKAVLFHGPFFGRGLGPVNFVNEYGRIADQQFWLLTHESNGNYNLQESGPDADLIQHLFTYDLDATVPITYAHRVWLQSYYQLYDKRTDADAIFVSSNCAPKNQRLIWVREIMKHIRVHSYGGCEHNIDMPEDRGQDSRKKLALQGSYKFCLCFDNTDQKDYISEKFFHALASGCVPVYMGTPTIDKYLPTPEAAVLTRDFDSPQALAKHLKYLIDNPEEYNKKLAWKGGGVHGNGTKQGMERLINLRYLSYATGPCRLCEHLSDVTSERTLDEKRILYHKTVSTMVQMEPWGLYHDKDGHGNIDFSLDVL